ADVVVGKADMERLAVRLRVDRDGLDAKLAARANDAQRDLATVRDENFTEHGRSSARASATHWNRPRNRTTMCRCSRPRLAPGARTPLGSSRRTPRSRTR